MTETQAIGEAFGSAKAHGITFEQLQVALGKGPHETKKIIATCAELLRKRGYETCADFLLKMKWTDGPSA